MELTFFGAARAVTGSAFLLEHDGFSVLVDLGLPQGSDEKEAGDDLPFSPSMVDAVVLTHAHIDHSGRLPLLAKQGYTGPIYSTEATAELSSIMLEDSAHIQESEAEWKTRKRKRHGEPAVEPLYTAEDADAALELFQRGGDLLGRAALLVPQAQRLPHKKFIVPALRVNAVGRIAHSFVPFFSSALMRMEQKSGPHIVQKRLPCCGLTEEASSARFRYSRARSGSSARSNCLSQSNWARA